MPPGRGRTCAAHSGCTMLSHTHKKNDNLNRPLQQSELWLCSLSLIFTFHGCHEQPSPVRAAAACTPNSSFDRLFDGWGGGCSSVFSVSERRRAPVVALYCFPFSMTVLNRYWRTQKGATAHWRDGRFKVFTGGDVCLTPYCPSR